VNGGGELARTLCVAAGTFRDVHHNALIARATRLHGDSNHIGKALRRLGFLPSSFSPASPAEVPMKRLWFLAVLLALCSCRSVSCASVAAATAW